MAACHASSSVPQRLHLFVNERAPLTFHNPYNAISLWTECQNKGSAYLRLQIQSLRLRAMRHPTWVSPLNKVLLPKTVYRRRLNLMKLSPHQRLIFSNSLA